MEITQESLQTYIPYYLTQEAKINLVKALNDFPLGLNYYTILHSSDYLQGDGWSQLEVVSIETREKKFIKGIFLSNGCDIDPKNRRELAPNVCFSPIIKLKNYISRLEKAGVDKQKIQNKVESIRDQKITTLFYLPQGGRLDTDYVALLDNIHTMSISQFDIEKRKEKLFTLSQAGFYIFLFKLSIHFCRFHEQINRD